MRPRQLLPALSAIFLLAVTSIAQADVDYRLPSTVKPVFQSIELNLDPSRPDFSGSVSIEIEVAEDRDNIGIYQLGLTFDSITLSNDKGKRTLSPAQGEYDMHWLADGEKIAAGRYTLDIEYHGDYATDSLGMHRVTFEDNEYIFTQFEAMYGRRAIPLFDEPAFKFPYQLTINAPAGLTVVANNPVAKHSEKDGWQRVEFEKTPPLPSYLIAYAVGPLDRAPIEGMSVPGYVYTPKGHADQVGFVTRETPKIVAALEEYFDLEYPYKKLDFVAVPEFAFGAMENPGLITYRTDLMLVGDQVSGLLAQSVLGVIAHEVAHIWYGDLVTMAWWDDIWLNESFATWMAQTIIRNLYPEFETNLSLGRSSAFAGDQSTTTRPIRSEVKTEKDYGTDLGLRYSKGQAILGMLESYIGPAAWQKAIRQYVRDFAWGNATDYDLWNVVSRESGMDVTRIANDFLSQPGYALLSFDKDGKVTQQRYMPYGIEAQDLHWRIPLTVKYKKDGQVRETFYLLDDRTGALDIPRGADWLYPDAKAMGYYRWQIDPNQFTSLVSDMSALSNREQKALLDNSEALWAARKQSISDYLDVVDQLLEHEHPLVFQSALTAIAGIGEELLQEEDRELYAAYLNRRLSGRFAEFGVEHRPGDSEAIIKMRPYLVALLGSDGSNPDVIRAAETLTENFFADAASVEAVLAAAALVVVAENDEAAERYTDYIDAYENAQSQIQKTVILQSMAFRNPEVVGKHLDFSISPAVAAGDAAMGVGTYSAILDDHRIIYDWMDKNIDAFQAKIPGYMHAYLPQIMAGKCTPANRKMLNDFFVDRGEVYAESLAKALESQDQCIARKAREHGDFRAWLESVSPPAT